MSARAMRRGTERRTFDQLNEETENLGASVGVDAGTLRHIEPFPTGELIPFDPGYLAGWTVERYQIDLVAAADRSRERMTTALQQLCGNQVHADTYRNLVVNATFSNQTFKQILAPVWLLTYTYAAKVYQLIVNGHSGRMAGQYPKSPWKIALIVLGVIILIIIFLLAQGNG